MDPNKKVVFFTIVSTVILLILSFFSTLTGTDILSFKNVNIISDVFETTHKKGRPNWFLIQQAQKKTSANYNFDDYVSPHVMVHFGANTAMPALPEFFEKLYALRKNKKAKIRIGWLGDSIIEGDLLTQTFRKQMQGMFGGYGVGFISAQSISAGSRSTVKHSWSGKWQEESFKNNKFTAPLFLSGHIYYTDNGTVEITDFTVPDSDNVQPLEKSLICGPVAGNVDIIVNGVVQHCSPVNQINRIALNSDNTRHISVTIKNKALPVYGISFEPTTGVLVDNFSFRGISGGELAKLDSSFLAELDQQHYYDLIIIEYGVNVMFRPDDMNYSYYKKMMSKCLKKMHNAMPHTEFLLISTSDRAFKYDGKWETAIGIDSVVKTQADLAYSCNMAFYNMYASMGGPGTIVRWADSTPALANQDYVHPNHKGAQILGNMLFDDFMSEMKKIGTKK